MNHTKDTGISLRPNLRIISGIVLKQIAIIGLLGLSPFAAQGQRGEIDSLRQLLETEANDSAKVDILNDLGYAYSLVNSDTGLLYVEMALTLANEIGYQRGQAMAHNKKGVVYYTMAEDDLSLESQLTSLDISRKIADSTTMAKAYHGIGIIYDVRGDTEESLLYFKLANNIARRFNLDRVSATTSLSLGVGNWNLGNSDSAIYYTDQAIIVGKKIGFDAAWIAASKFLAKILVADEKYEEALLYLREPLARSMEIELNQQSADILLTQGQIYRFLGLYQRSREAFEQSISLAHLSGSLAEEQDAYDKLYALDTLQGRYDLALAHYVKAAALNDSIYNTENARQINELTASYEADKREREITLQQNQIDLLEKEKEIKRVWRNTLIGGIIMVLIGGSGLFIAQRQKIIERKKVVEAELENSNLKAKQLQTELDLKNKELTSYTINFIRKRELFENLQNQLTALRNDPSSEFDQEIHSISRLILENNNIDKDWEDFKMYFENVHKDFFTRLKQLHPTIGTAELRLCSLIKLNMNVKETAAILGISPDSVKTARYRLRKKLGLDGESSLSDYIINIDSSIQAYVGSS